MWNVVKSGVDWRRYNWISIVYVYSLRISASRGSITTTGFVRIFFARAAYRNVFNVSDKFDRAGETHAIWIK